MAATLMTLWLAVKAAQAFETMLQRWCGLGLWEFDFLEGGGEGGCDRTHLEGSYSVSRCCVLFQFEMFEMPTVVPL